jgi:hypothetical protein
MRWLAVAADTVHRDLHFVAFGLVDHSAVLRRSRKEFQLRLFQFPDSHEVVLGETHWYSHKHRATVSTIVLIFISLLDGETDCGRSANGVVTEDPRGSGETKKVANL